MEKRKFYNSIRDSIFNGKISLSQVKGMEIILNEITAHGISDKRWIAYMLATVFHETAKTMQPIEEYGKGKEYAYGKKLDMGKGPGKRVPYTTPDKLYYGRGFVMITWRCNYLNMGRILGVDLLNNPELALNHKISAQILIEGMIKGDSSFGDFTGKSLDNYFNDKTTDWVNARKIINGLDKADLIASYAKKFFEALR